MKQTPFRASWMLLLLCGLMLLCAAALADELPHYNTCADYHLQMPSGIVLQSETYDADTGWLRLVVDTAQSKFDQALSTGYDASLNSLIFRGNLVAPASCTGNYEGLAFSPASPENLKELIANFRTMEANFAHGSGNQPGWMWFMGSYDASKGIFFPQNRTFGTIAVWDKNDSEPYVLMIDLRYTSTEPIPAKPQMLPEKNILADYRKVLSAEDQITLQDGSIRYTRTATTSAELTTGVTVPGLQAGQTMYWSNGGDMNKGTPVGTTAEGESIFEFTWPTAWESGDVARECSYSIVVKDAHDVVCNAFQLSISLVQGEKKPWPEYAGTDAEINQPIYAAGSQTQFGQNRFRYHLDGGFDGVSLSYENGVLMQHVDNEKLLQADGRLMDELCTVVTLTPPEGAVCYSVRSTGGQIVFGPDGLGYYDEPAADMRQPVLEGETHWYPFFSSVPYQDGQRVYYRSGIEYTTDLGGMVPLYFWYDSFDATQPMLVEYFVRMAQPVLLSYTTEVLDDLEDIPQGQEDQPFIVIANWQGSGKTYTFQAEMLPTGENSRYYELKLMDHQGNSAALPSLKADRYLVYLPYPKGVNLDRLSFYVSHLDPSGETVKELYAFDSADPKLRLNRAPNNKGLYFEVSSLSPFVLSWEEEVPPAAPASGNQLPQTGDATPLLLYGLLLAGSGLAFASVRKKKAHS